jgi:hypothetical protein
LKAEEGRGISGPEEYRENGTLKAKTFKINHGEVFFYGYFSNKVGRF